MSDATARAYVAHSDENQTKQYNLALAQVLITHIKDRDLTEGRNYTMAAFCPSCVNHLGRRVTLSRGWKTSAFTLAVLSAFGNICIGREGFQTVNY